MKLIGSYLKRNIAWISILIWNILMMYIIMELNGVAISEWGYGLILTLFLMFAVGGVNFVYYCKRHRYLQEAKKSIEVSIGDIKASSDVLEQDYLELLKTVHEEKMMAVDHLEHRKKDLSEYYTMWVHQIKTPIAAMGLLLQREETPRSRECEEELFRIEQYVEMALHYTRIDADTTDFIIQKYSLDKLLREAIRKYAKFFIRKKISLNYEPLETEVLTDEKWLVFVIEQVLSNAIKYTPKGSVSIYMEGEDTLVIEDTGIGIKKEDLPRVCEKGYTGYNGHVDKRSTGIGLYLCKRILENLSHTISIESEMGKGTCVKIGLITKEQIHE